MPGQKSQLSLTLFKHSTVHSYHMMERQSLRCRFRIPIKAEDTHATLTDVGDRGIKWWAV